MKKTLKPFLLIAAVVWLGQACGARAQSYELLGPGDLPRPAAPFLDYRVPAHQANDAPRRLARLLERLSGGYVILDEAWVFDEYGARSTVCGSARFNGRHRVFILQHDNGRYLATLDATRRQYQYAGCDRPGAATLVEPGYNWPMD